MPIDVHEAPDVVRQLCETCHDMREPVATVRALAAAALTEPGLPVAAQVRLEQISMQAEWLAELIHEFLHDAVEEKEEKQGQALETGDRQWRAVIRPDAVRVVNQVIMAGRMTWSCDLTVTSPAAPVWYTLHPVLLRRVVSNVLSNAARAAGPSGLVTVRIWQNKGMIRLVVEDSGPGFGNVPSGLGLGLAWVVRTVVKHGGRIECGRGAAGGARVSLWVP